PDMANSKYEYVKMFEKHTKLLPLTYIVVRIDGRGFHKLSQKYGFRKPNDVRALELMNASAIAVMKELPDICMSYGISDEYSFIFEKPTELFERRESKLITTVVSTFTAHYVHAWSDYFPNVTLTQPLPSFDGRAIEYPTKEALRDYMSWRQVDCHVNNLFNTAFWALVQRGCLNETQAEEALKGTNSSDKHEILFSRFSINYNNEPESFRKGTVIYRSDEDVQTFQVGQPAKADLQKPSKMQCEKDRKRKIKPRIVIDHIDIIKNGFWESKPWLLS
ncbi:MAG: hypothetical protein LQ340_007522, partial [Diploschistes diacapsis]